jgi:hypothetical protein
MDSDFNGGISGQRTGKSSHVRNLILNEDLSGGRAVPGAFVFPQCIKSGGITRHHLIAKFLGLPSWEVIVPMKSSAFSVILLASLVPKMLFAFLLMILRSDSGVLVRCL